MYGNHYKSVHDIWRFCCTKYIVAKGLIKMRRKNVATLPQKSSVSFMDWTYLSYRKIRRK